MEGVRILWELKRISIHQSVSMSLTRTGLNQWILLDTTALSNCRKSNTALNIVNHSITCVGESSIHPLEFAEKLLPKYGPSNNLYALHLAEYCILT